MKDIEEGLNIKELLSKLDYGTTWGAVAINATFVSLKEYETTIIKDRDTIDILSPVQGG